MSVQHAGNDVVQIIAHRYIFVLDMPVPVGVNALHIFQQCNIGNHRPSCLYIKVCQGVGLGKTDRSSSSSFSIHT